MTSQGPKEQPKTVRRENAALGLSPRLLKMGRAVVPFGSFNRTCVHRQNSSEHVPWRQEKRIDAQGRSGKGGEITD